MCTIASPFIIYLGFENEHILIYDADAKVHGNLSKK